MLEFARAQFALSKPDKTTGKTRLQLLIEIRNQTGIVGLELQNRRPAPIETEHIWRWFRDLNSSRTAGFGINALSWSDTYAYFQLRGIKPDAWELDTLRALDEAYLSIQMDEKSATVAGARSLKQRVSGQQP